MTTAADTDNDQKQFREVCNPRFEKLNDAIQGTRAEIYTTQVQAEKRQGQILVEISDIKKTLTYLVTKNGNGSGPAPAAAQGTQAPGPTTQEQIVQRVLEQVEKKNEDSNLARELKLVKWAWNLIPAKLQPAAFVFGLYELARLFDYLAQHQFWELIKKAYGLLAP